MSNTGFNTAIFGVSFSTRVYYPNLAAMQEITVSTKGISADSEQGGPQVNYVPKDGGNRFSMYADGSGSGPALQGNNLTQGVPLT